MSKEPTTADLANSLYSASVVSTAWSSLMIDAANRLKRLEAAEAKLEELQYRHESLKQLFEDVSGFGAVDNAIDEFIREEQSHG